MTNINYEKAFKKLVHQIVLERQWAEEDRLEKEKAGYKDPFDRGCIFECNSFKKLADKIMRGTINLDIQKESIDWFDDEYGL